MKHILLRAALGLGIAGPGIAATAAPVQPSQVRETDAQVNGIRLHYRIAGSGSAVVLIHGYTQTGHMWHPVIAELARRHTVIVPDLRGAGGSDKPLAGYQKKQLAQDVHALVASLGYRDATVVGHDIGLMVAYAYAGQRDRQGDHGLGPLADGRSAERRDAVADLLRPMSAKGRLVGKLWRQHVQKLKVTS